MFKKPSLLIALAAIGLAQCSKSELATESAVSNEPAAVISNENSTSDRYIVKFRDNVIPAQLNPTDYQTKKELVRTFAEDLLGNLGIDANGIVHVYGEVYPGIALPLKTNELEALRKHPTVHLISEDEVISLDYIEENGESINKAQTTPWGINRVGTADGTGKTAWILDTGVDLDHPDLKVDELRSESFASLDGTFLSNNGDDNHGHGSHVAGTVAALDNNIGVIGVAAGATIVSVKVLGGNGSGLLSDVIAGIDYTAALSLPGDVANMSLGGGANSLIDWAVMSAALKGTWFIMAAGNNRAPATNHSPGRANGPFLVTVSAFRSGDRWASFSNYGNPPVDYAGPGQGVLSTYKNKGYRTLSGTSMATPHVAGLFLISNGRPNVNGTVAYDPDGNPDPIAVY